jgi:hypothetical protein
VVTQSRGSEGTDMNELSVLTTARRTFGIVCRKKGKRVGARAESGSLDNLGLKLLQR